jgi:glycine dehydrogenase subunit 2
MLRKAPYRMPVRRLDDVRAARELDLAFRPGPAPAAGSAPAAG